MINLSDKTDNFHHTERKVYRHGTLDTGGIHNLHLVGSKQGNCSCAMEQKQT